MFLDLVHPSHKNSCQTMRELAMTHASNLDFQEIYTGTQLTSHMTRSGSQRLQASPSLGASHMTLHI